jgi:hypothetical protein
MAEAPIQVVLNADNYHTERERPNGGGREADFFEGNDAAFVAHKNFLRRQLEGVAEAIESNPFARTGFGKITLRRSRWAKTHRPTRALFRPERTRSVGGTDLGEFIVELTPDRARRVSADIGATEDVTRYRQNRKTGREEAAPSRARAETSAIQTIALWQPADRRRFTVEQALEWFQDPRSSAGYLVELFERPIPEADWDTLTDYKRTLFRSFREGLLAAGPGLVVESRSYSPAGRVWMLVRLEQSMAPPRIQLDTESRLAARGAGAQSPDLSIARHADLLAFLDQHPLVRRVRLQPRVSRSHVGTGAPMASGAKLPVPTTGTSYPKVGVIDGGICTALDPWIQARWSLLAPAHQDLAHGSFIGALLVAGGSLNREAAIAEPDGCTLADIGLLPTESNPAAFGQYFPNGVTDFVDEVEAAVGQTRQQYGIRVFNLSINVQDLQADPDGYSPFAERLDAIADATDSIFVISAGNLHPANLRAEWPVDPLAALRIFAATQCDRVLVPAESIRNISVNAINPAGIAPCVPYALANYSRRGPGLRTGVKPDFCHIGGAGQTRLPIGTGLKSIDTAGVLTEGCGTSYAAPLLARTLAGIDAAIEGGVSRETLLALTVHHASRPEPFQAEALTGLARELVGFGMPLPTDAILQGSEHQVTLVFSGRLQKDKQLTFNFTWPDVLTARDGRCSGYARLTLATHPPLDYRFGAELVRVNVNARLQQAKLGGGYQGQLHETYLPIAGDDALYESEMIEQGFKWSPVKTYARNLPRGIGKSSSWRLVVDTLTRANEPFPERGVPFSAILTIADPSGEQPVFNAMRQSLQALGVQIADVRVAARVVARV